MFSKLWLSILSISLSLGGVRSSCNVISRILNPVGLKERGKEGAERERKRKTVHLQTLFANSLLALSCNSMKYGT